MSRVISYGFEARNRLKEGIEKLYKAVSITLGPRGRNVAYGGLLTGAHITKDGVTVAKQVELDDPIENTGVWLVREASMQTAEEAGDGTTTAVVLAYSIYAEGLRYIAAGASPKYIKNGIEYAVSIVVDALRKMAKSVDDYEMLRHVATISANGDAEVGAIVAEAVYRAGIHGVITLEKSTTATIDGKPIGYRTIEGIKIKHGVLSPYFLSASGDRSELDLEDVYVVLYDSVVSNIHDVIPFLEFVASEKKPIILIAEDFSSEVLTMMMVNKIKAIATVYPIKIGSSPLEKANVLEDVAAMAGNEVLYRERGNTLRDISAKYVGIVKKAKLGLKESLFIGYPNEKLSHRISFLESELNNNVHDPVIADDLRRRIASLKTGVTVIMIGGYTEVEISERYDRVEDAVHASMSALQEGIVPGGGTALLRCVPKLRNQIERMRKKARSQSDSDFIAGMEIVSKAIQAPLRVIAQNAGDDPSYIYQLVANSNGFRGYNAEKGVIEDLYKAGVIDPVKVVRLALTNASSVSSLLLTTECVIAETPDKTSSKT